MKKNFFIPLILFDLLFFSFSSNCTLAYTNTKVDFIDVPPKSSNEKIYKDIVSSLLLPYIQKSVSDYYSNILTDIPSVDPWGVHILNIERPGKYESFIFVLKIQVTPYVGPSVGVGVDQLTITVYGSGDVTVNKFEHIKSYELPPNYQNIIKKS